MSLSLIEITSEIQEIMQLVDDEMENTGGDVSEGSAGAQLMERMATYDLKLKEKLDAYATVVWVLEKDAEVLKDETARMAERAQAFKNKARRMKDLLGFCMLQLGQRKLQGIRFTAALQAHGGKPPLRLKVDDPLKVPTRFLKVTTSIDTDKVRTALEAGDPQAAVIAEILPRGESVRIR